MKIITCSEAPTMMKCSNRSDLAALLYSMEDDLLSNLWTTSGDVGSGNVNGLPPSLD